MDDGRKTFQWYDILIFVATLVISLGIGLYFSLAGGKQKTTKEYLMGNRNLGVIPVAMSMFMSYISAILILGNSAESYTRGTQQWLASVGSSLAAVITVVFFVPLFYPLKITSSFEYLQMRFNSRFVRLTGTVLLMLSQVLYMGIAMFSPATALEAATGNIKTWMSILATGFVGTLYTTVGGMKAVVWTDVFQAFVMIGGLIIVLIMGMIRTGGPTEVWNIALEGKRLDMFNFDPSPLLRMSFWSVIVGRVISSSQTLGTGQTSVQRYSALPTLKKAKVSVLLSIPCMIFVYTLTSLVGLVVYAYYTKLGCDPLRTNKISSSNQILPFFIVNDLNTPALPGLFVAVLFCGALSTLSSSLSALAAVSWKDLLEPHFGHISEPRKALINKGLVIFFGAISIGVAFLAQVFGGHVLQAAQSFVSSVAGPLLGIFILGAFFPCANWKGAIVGGWLGLAMGMTMAIGAYITKPYRQTLPTVTTNCSTLTPPWNITKGIAQDPEGVFPLFRVSFMYFATMATLTTVIVGLIISILTGGIGDSERDPRLVIPVLDRVLCCLPRRITSVCWCGVRHDEVKVDDNGHYLVKPGQEEDESGQNEEESAKKDVTSSKHDLELETRVTDYTTQEVPPSYDQIVVRNSTNTHTGHDNRAFSSDTVQVRF